MSHGQLTRSDDDSSTESGSSGWRGLGSEEAVAVAEDVDVHADVDVWLPMFREYF